MVIRRLCPPTLGATWRTYGQVTATSATTACQALSATTYGQVTATGAPLQPVKHFVPHGEPMDRSPPPAPLQPVKHLVPQPMDRSPPPVHHYSLSSTSCHMENLWTGHCHQFHYSLSLSATTYGQVTTTTTTTACSSLKAKYLICT